MQMLLAPENLFFELPLLLAITLTIMQLIGGLEAGHTVHVDAGHAVDHDLGHDAIWSDPRSISRWHRLAR